MRSDTIQENIAYCVPLCDSSWGIWLGLSEEDRLPMKPDAGSGWGEREVPVFLLLVFQVCSRQIRGLKPSRKFQGLSVL